MEIHERLLIFREKLGLNKSEMAEKLQKSHVAYGKYESGKDRLNINLLLILGKLGCDLHWLITGEEKGSKNEIIELRYCKEKIKDLELERDRLYNLLAGRNVQSQEGDSRQPLNGTDR